MKVVKVLDKYIVLKNGRKNLADITNIKRIPERLICSKTHSIWKAVDHHNNIIYVCFSYYDLMYHVAFLLKEVIYDKNKES